MAECPILHHIFMPESQVPVHRAVGSGWQSGTGPRNILEPDMVVKSRDLHCNYVHCATPVFGTFLDTGTTGYKPDRFFIQQQKL